MAPEARRPEARAAHWVGEPPRRRPIRLWLLALVGVALLLWLVSRGSELMTEVLEGSATRSSSISPQPSTSTRR